MSVGLIPMPSSSRSPIVSPDVQSDAASSTSFNVQPTKPIVLQHVRFDADSIEGASASGPRTLPTAAVRAVTWPGRRLWARGLGVGALLGGVLIHQHVRAAVEQAVHEELAEVLGVELYERRAGNAPGSRLLRELLGETPTSAETPSARPDKG